MMPSRAMGPTMLAFRIGMILAPRPRRRRKFGDFREATKIESVLRR
jgi:hypothetical protein